MCPTRRRASLALRFRRRCRERSIIRELRRDWRRTIKLYLRSGTTVVNSACPCHWRRNTSEKPTLARCLSRFDFSPPTLGRDIRRLRNLGHFCAQHAASRMCFDANGHGQAELTTVCPTQYIYCAAPNHGAIRE